MSNRMMNPHELNMHSHACVVAGRCVEGLVFEEYEEKRLACLIAELERDTRVHQ